MVVHARSGMFALGQILLMGPVSVKNGRPKLKTPGSQRWHLRAECAHRLYPDEQRPYRVINLTQITLSMDTTMQINTTSPGKVNSKSGYRRIQVASIAVPSYRVPSSIYAIGIEYDRATGKVSERPVQ